MLCLLLASLSILGQQDSLTQSILITNTDERIFLNVGWKYRLGDNPDWAGKDFDDSNWDTISPFFDPSMFNNSEQPVIWLRILFEVDSTAIGIPYSLNIYFSNRVSIYFDGNFFAEFEENSNILNSFKPSWKPLSIKQAGFSSIAIRLQVDKHKFFRNAGVFNGISLSIRKLEPAVNDTIRFVRRETAIEFVFVILPLAFSLLHLILFLYFRKTKANLIYSLFLFFLSLATYADIQSVNFATSHFLMISILRFHRAFLIPLQIAILLFTYTILSERIPKIFWVFSAIFVGTGIAAIILPETNFRIFSLTSILLVLEVIRMIVMAIRKKKKGIWIFAMGFSFILFFSSYDLMLDQGWLQPLMEYQNGYFLGYIGMYISMSILLARQVAATNNELELRLMEVKSLSDKTIEQEQEKQEILSLQKEKLEITVEERTRELEEEKEKTETLLLNTLPLKVVNDLKIKGISVPEVFTEVTVFFSDFVGFTVISTHYDPQGLIEELNDLFTIFDKIMLNQNCERIKTIGDAYLAVCGMPDQDEQHAEKMVSAALEVIKQLEARNALKESKWQLRIGISSGPVVGGIVGRNKYLYDIFGDTVNMAARMEQHSLPMKINISSATCQLIKDRFIVIPRTKTDVKGMGEIDMYFVEDKKS